MLALAKMPLEDNLLLLGGLALAFVAWSIFTDALHGGDDDGDDW